MSDHAFMQRAISTLIMAATAVQAGAPVTTFSKTLHQLHEALVVHEVRAALKTHFPTAVMAVYARYWADDDLVFVHLICTGNADDIELADTTGTLREVLLESTAALNTIRPEQVGEHLNAGEINHDGWDEFNIHL